MFTRGGFLLWLRLFPQTGLFGGCLQAGKDSLAALELLGEELVQLVEHFEQIGGGGARNHQLQLVPAKISVQEDGRRSALKNKFKTNKGSFIFDVIYRRVGTSCEEAAS